MNWFEVDKAGLAKLLDRKGGKQFAVFELVQNAWDENTTKVSVVMKPVVGKRQVRITVTDDNPEGFKNLTHAFTLFAESTKKADPTKRGRFNLGEKLVLACCVEAEISTTTGTIVFNDEGRSRSYRKTEAGSVFDGYLKMTNDEYEEICKAVKSLIPPDHISTTFNGVELVKRQPIAAVEATLPTEIADEEGVLRRTARKTTVRVYKTLDGEKAAIYEMGVPVVEFDEEDGDEFHVEVCQKIPLNMDRDNVPPAYLSQLRTLTLNATFNQLDAEDAKATWVRDAASSKDADPAAIEKVMTLRYGDKRVAYDPSDPEANRKAMSLGYTVVSGGSLTSGEWSNVRSSGTILPAGQVTPTSRAMFSPDGEPPLSESEWTEGMKRVAKFAKWVAKMAAGVKDLDVYVYHRLTSDVGSAPGACYGRSGDRAGSICFSLQKLGHAFFNDFPKGCNSHGNAYVRVLDLLIHELAHHFSDNHLSDEYYSACTHMGAVLTALALTDRSLFPYKPE